MHDKIKNKAVEKQTELILSTNKMKVTNLKSLFYLELKTYFNQKHLKYYNINNTVTNKELNN